LTGSTRENFYIPLNPRGDAIRVRIVRQGKTFVDFVIQYEAFIDGRYRPVVRYDGSHGTPHRDTLDWDDETIKKDWDLEATTHNDAVTEAIDDIQANWERYLDGFLRRRP
jgi:hypothetical protein